MIPFYNVLDKKILVESLITGLATIITSLLHGIFFLLNKYSINITETGLPASSSH